MKNYKDTRIEQTPTQSNPYAARPEDFEVGRDDVPGHGQHGDSESEYNQLLKQADANVKKARPARM
jgi:hypothetical protein